MRCACCNKNLNDFESTRKHAVTGEYLDTCNKCIKSLGIDSVVRGDLNPDEVIDDEFDLWEEDIELEESDDEGY